MRPKKMFVVFLKMRSLTGNFKQGVTTEHYGMWLSKMAVDRSGLGLGKESDLRCLEYAF